ncbi:MAG: cytochrome b/b6 domain-containing protein [Candidatus Marinimicrobia bacterium]|nr:cytochrome b/b6 domain-containing protein [Candidatus Neomarinimicrobiota bacterium]
MSREYTRFSVNQRLQHFFMFVPFIILVITGFPIKYPESSFGSFVFAAIGGIETARSVHRFAAAIMILDFVFHVAYVAYNILVNRAPLSKLYLLPGKKDAQDILKNLKYFLFLSDERPRFHKFSYIEKFDYWAVFWGMFIMAGSGIILWFPVEFSRIVPGVVIQIAYIAHSDEALLAFLAIIIWHFYNVHFNPRVWPANKVWYKGTLTEEEMEHEHPMELEEIKEKEKEER